MKARALQFLKRLQTLPFENSPYESHAGRLPGFLGECALSFIHDWPEARDWLEYCTLIYMTAYPAWGGDDGGWQEGPSYWGAYMSFAIHFVVALRQATGIDLMQKPFFRNTPFFAFYTATPYHEQRPFGDGAESSPCGLGAIMYAFSSLLRDPYLRWLAEECRFRPGADVLTVATYDPTLKARSPLKLPQTRVFPSVGLASIHTALGDRERDIDFCCAAAPMAVSATVTPSKTHLSSTLLVEARYCHRLLPVVRLAASSPMHPRHASRQQHPRGRPRSGATQFCRQRAHHRVCPQRRL